MLQAKILVTIMYVCMYDCALLQVGWSVHTGIEKYNVQSSCMLKFGNVINIISDFFHYQLT